MAPTPVGLETTTWHVPAGVWPSLTARGDEPRAVWVTAPHVTDRVSWTVLDHVNVACTGPPPTTVHVAETVSDPKFSAPGLGPGTVDAVAVLELPVVLMATEVIVGVDTDVDVTGIGADVPGAVLFGGTLVLVPTPEVLLPCPAEPVMPRPVEPRLAIVTSTGGVVPPFAPGAANAPSGALVGVACGRVPDRLECPRAAVTAEDPAAGRSPSTAPVPEWDEPAGAAGSRGPGDGRERAATRAISARATASTTQPRGRVIVLPPGSLPRRRSRALAF